jgi:hypothetical protein
MNVQWISLAALLAVLAGCPDTPPENSGIVAQARKKIAIGQLADAESESTTVRGAAPEGGERFDR